MKIWRSLDTIRPDMALDLGDWMYFDVRNNETKLVCWHETQTHPCFGDVLSIRPWYLMWDDHDFGLNDAAGANQNDTINRAALTFFQNHFPNPYYGNGLNNDMYGTFFDIKTAKVQFFCTDGRMFKTQRSTSCSTDSTIHQMGFNQIRQWYLPKMDSSTAKFKPMVNSTSWETGLCSDAFRGAQYEKDSIIIKHFIQNSTTGWHTIEGDRHRHDFREHGELGFYKDYAFLSARFGSLDQEDTTTGSSTKFSRNEFQGFYIIKYSSVVDSVWGTIYSVDHKNGYKVSIALNPLTSWTSAIFKKSLSNMSLLLIQSLYEKAFISVFGGTDIFECPELRTYQPESDRELQWWWRYDGIGVPVRIVRME